MSNSHDPRREKTTKYRAQYYDRILECRMHSKTVVCHEKYALVRHSYTESVYAFRERPCTVISDRTGPYKYTEIRS